MRTRIALPGTLLLLFGYYAAGQEITATISGRVTDPTGAVVPGATITVVSTDKAVTVRSLRTSGGGQYAVPLLSVGHYNVTAEASGFNRSSQTGSLLLAHKPILPIIKRHQGPETDIYLEVVTQYEKGEEPRGLYLSAETIQLLSEMGGAFDNDVD
jgi:hypothetical protein